MDERKKWGQRKKEGERVENERRDELVRLKIKETKSEPECLRMARSRNNCKKKKGKIIWGSNVVATMMFDLQMEGGKKTTLLNHLSPETFARRGFGKPATPTDNQVVALIMGAHDIIPRWRQTHTYPHTGSASHADSGPATPDELSTHAQHITTQTTHTHALFRDMGPVLTTAKLTWRWSNRSVPRKAKRTRERAGAFVFVECHTSSRGEPVTGPGRPLKLWEGCVGIASVATSDVNSNILIAGCFLD